MVIYYGKETKKALDNFSFSVDLVKEEFIFSIVKIKRSAALANYKDGKINIKKKDAIIRACDEILYKKHRAQFPLPSLQGGAGTAINMNVNEVIANRATEILKNKIVVHAYNDVNCSQSTNDVNPSALKISSLILLRDLNTSLDNLISSLDHKSKEFKDILKLGRTHLQDAVPTTLGKEFSSYRDTIKKHKKQIDKSIELSRSINLGGTAIGNSINASPTYIKEIYQELNKFTGELFIKAPNFMSQTSSQTDFLIISQSIVSLCVDISKIANDLRFMSSGPNGGIGEIILPELQNGSSIMPGKINPVMPEVVNQLYYLVSGNNLTIEKAVESSQMELGVMLPIISEKLLESIEISGKIIDQFTKRCILGIKANKENCLKHLESSTAYATLFVPRLGYDLVSEIIFISLKNKKTFRDMIVSGGYLSDEEFDKIIKGSINNL